MVSLFKDFSRPSKQNFSSLSPCRIKIIPEQKSGADFTYFEVSDLKNDKKNEEIVVENENVKKVDVDNCFDIKFAKNYLVFITNFKEIQIDLLKDENFSNRNYFLILGIVLNEKTTQTEVQKIVTYIQRESFMKYKNIKNDWFEVNILPLEKITTFIRFYFCLKSF